MAICTEQHLVSQRHAYPLLWIFEVVATCLSIVQEHWPLLEVTLPAPMPGHGNDPTASTEIDTESLTCSPRYTRMEEIAQAIVV